MRGAGLKASIFAAAACMSAVSEARAADYTAAQVRVAVQEAGGAKAFVRNMADETAEALPTKINREVEMISVAAHGLSITYVSKLVNVDFKDVADVEQLKAANVNYALCKTPVMGILIAEFEVKAVYVVLARGAEYLFQYQLDKRICTDRYKK